MLYEVFMPKLSIILTFFGFPVVSFRANTFASTIFTRLNDIFPLLLDNEGVPKIFPSINRIFWLTDLLYRSVPVCTSWN